MHDRTPGPCGATCIARGIRRSASASELSADTLSPLGMAGASGVYSASAPTSGGFLLSGSLPRSHAPYDGSGESVRPAPVKVPMTEGAIEQALFRQGKALERQAEQIALVLELLKQKSPLLSGPLGGICEEPKKAGAARVSVSDASSASTVSDGSSDDECLVQPPPTSPLASRRSLCHVPSSPGIVPGDREHASSGIFKKLLNDEVSAYRVYVGDPIFAFSGNDYDRGQFEFLFLCALSPLLEETCYVEAWDALSSDIREQALAVNACFECLAKELGLLAGDTAKQLKSNNGSTAKVKYPHQQFLYTTRGTLNGYKLQEADVNIIINSQLFNGSFKLLLDAYKGRPAGSHTVERAKRYYTSLYDDRSSRFGGLVDDMKSRLNDYAERALAEGCNLELLLSIFPTRDTWRKPASFGVSVSGK